MKMLAITALALLLPISSGFAELKLGEPLPVFTLPSITDGRALSTNHLSGKKLVLHLFASW